MPPTLPISLVNTVFGFNFRAAIYSVTFKTEQKLVAVYLAQGGLLVRHRHRVPGTRWVISDVFFAAVSWAEPWDCIQKLLPMSAQLGREAQFVHGYPE